MKSPTITRHEFVEYIPDELDERVLYVSIRFATAVHLCYCGCGSEVVTPLSPTGWQMLFDGTSITVYPSIGSWGLKCRSHYWIDHGVVRWARTWSDHEIATARRRDTRDKELEFEFKISTDSAIEPFLPEEEDSRPASIWRQAVRRLLGRAGGLRRVKSGSRELRALGDSRTRSSQRPLSGTERGKCSGQDMIKPLIEEER